MENSDECRLKCANSMHLMVQFGMIHNSLNSKMLLMNLNYSDHWKTELRALNFGICVLAILL